MWRRRFEGIEEHAPPLRLFACSPQVVVHGNLCLHVLRVLGTSAAEVTPANSGPARNPLEVFGLGSQHGGWQADGTETNFFIGLVYVVANAFCLWSIIEHPGRSIIGILGKQFVQTNEESAPVVGKQKALSQ